MQVEWLEEEKENQELVVENGNTRFRTSISSKYRDLKISLCLCPQAQQTVAVSPRKQDHAGALLSIFFTTKHLKIAKILRTVDAGEMKITLKRRSFVYELVATHNAEQFLVSDLLYTFTI